MDALARPPRRRGCDRPVVRRPPPRRAGSDLGRRRAPPLPSLRLRVSYHPTTRAHVRLLGPCFKTGREGGRRDHGPRARTRLAPRAGDPAQTCAADSARAGGERRTEAGANTPEGGSARRPCLDPRPGRSAGALVTPPPRRGPPSHRESRRSRTGRGPRRSLVRWVVARAAPGGARERPRTGKQRAYAPN